MHFGTASGLIVQTVLIFMLMANQLTGKMARQGTKPKEKTNIPIKTMNTMRPHMETVSVAMRIARMISLNKL